MASASGLKGIGKPARCCERQKSWPKAIRAAPLSWRIILTISILPANSCSAPTCWRSARPSPRSSQRWKSIRSASAARRTRFAWFSMPPPGQPSTLRSSTSGTASALSSMKSTASRRRGICRSFPWRALCGNAGRISRPPVRLGSMRAAHTTRYSVTRSRRT